jgi:hypothetical protein
MKKWQPLIASALVIALALGAMAVWRFSVETPRKGSRDQPEPAGNTPEVVVDGDGIERVWLKLEELPTLDPLGLWPRNGQRIASPEFNVMWETAEPAQCRLIVSTNGRDWYSMGRTHGTRHFLPVNFGDFDSVLTFAVEFEAQGQRYRSKARSVGFGRGARFSQREHRFRLSELDSQGFPVEIAGRDPTGLPSNAFLTGWFPIELGTGVLPGESGTDGGSITFVVTSAGMLPQLGAHGYLELYDTVGDTHDRTLIFLSR